MQTITIEKIESAHVLNTCATILVSAYNSEPWHDNWTQEKALEKLNCFYHSPKFLGWTASLEGEIVGCCVGNIEPYYTGDYFYLKEMFVSHASQKQGIGTQLMAALKAHLISIDIQTMILFTGKDFFPFNFYLTSGFEVMEEMRMMHFGQ